MRRVRTAVLPAAGLGTRFLPATKSVPKELLPLLDRPVIDYIVAEAVEAGIERIVLITSRGKDALADFFDRSPSLEAHLRSTGKLALLDRVLEVCSRAEVVTIRQQQMLESIRLWLFPVKSFSTAPQLTATALLQTIAGHKPLVKPLA